MAQGAGQAIAENKAADKIKLVGFDNDDKLVGFLKDGTIVALVVQDPYRMGYDGIKTALAASKRGGRSAGYCRYGRKSGLLRRKSIPLGLGGAPESESEIAEPFPYLGKYQPELPMNPAENGEEDDATGAAATAAPLLVLEKLDKSFGGRGPEGG